MENKVITFGCRLNASESEAIKEILKTTDQKNLIVFNSCAVTSEAERQLRQSLRKARRENPDAKIVVTGCAAQINPQKYSKMEEVDLVLGNVEKTKKENYLFEDKKIEEEVVNEDFGEEKIKVNDIMSVKDTAPQLVSYFENKTRAFLEIQNGCNHRCTFCIIPFGRGNSRSVPFGEIVDQAKKLVDAGHKEIVFTGVDISDYGKDLPAPISLSQMIKRLLKLVPSLERLRLSSIDVAEIDDGILDLLTGEPRFMPHLHLSIQAGDDLILKRMKRRHNRAQILEFCEKTRKIRPDIAFGADIIAGFPTENEEMFERSLKIIEEADIVFTHIFPYSKRSGTPAARMPQVNGNDIKRRAKLLREAGAAQLQKFLQKQIGKNLKVICEKDDFGKSENFLNVKIAGNSSAVRVGDIVDVRIVSAGDGFLVGEAL